jgi:hypothetical protein
LVGLLNTPVRRGETPPKEVLHTLIPTISPLPQPTFNLRPIRRSRRARWSNMARCVRAAVLAMGVPLLAPMWLAASVPLELKDGRSFEIIGLERDGGTITLTTDTGVRFPMPASRIVPPDAAWTARAKQFMEEGNFEGAIETARLLRIWDPASADHAALLSAAQAAVHGTRGREFRDAVTGSNWGHVDWMIKEAAGDADMLRLFDETLGEAARRKKLELRAETLIGIERFLEHIDGLQIPPIAQVEELRTAITEMKRDQEDRSRALESRQRDLEQGRALQNAITQALSFSSQRQYDRARGVLEGLEPELREHPEVVRTLGLVEAQEVRERRTELIADINRMRRAQQLGDALRETTRLNKVLVGDRDLIMLERDLWTDHRRAVQSAKALQQQSRGAAINVSTRPGQSFQLFFPWAYEGDRPLPVVMALSAVGNGAEMVGLLETAATAHRFIIIAPNGSLGRGESRAALLTAIYEDFRHRFACDEAAGIIAGYDEGATAAIQYVARHPEYMFGALAMGGASTDLGGARAKSKFPIVFLAGQDQPAYFQQVRPAADYFRRLGHAVDVITYPGSTPRAPAAFLEQAILRLRDMQAAPAPGA